MPIMEVKHPSGQRVQIKFEGEPPLDRIKGLFASAPASSTAVAQGEPVSPEVDREIMAGRPMIQEYTPQQARQKFVDATPGPQMGRLAISGLKSGVEGVKKGVPQVMRGISQLLEPPEMPAAWKEAMDRGDLDAARRETPLPFSYAALQNPAASPEMTDAGEIVQRAPDKFVKGLLNTAVGAAEIGVGGVMAATPAGQAFAIVNQALNELPRMRSGGGIQDITNAALSPATTMNLAQYLKGQDPENAENINKGLDLGLGGGIIKGMHEGFKKAPEVVRPEYGGKIQSTIIPADPMEAVRAIRDLTKRIGFMGNKNDVRELNKVFDTNVTHDGEFRPGIQQYTVHDPSIPPYGATFTADASKGETLADAFVKRMEKFAGAKADQALAGGTPSKPGPMTARSQDVNANRLMSGLGAGGKRMAETIKKGAKRVVEGGALLTNEEGKGVLKNIGKGTADVSSMRPDAIYYLEKGGGTPIAYVIKPRGTALRKGELLVGEDGTVHRDLYRGVEGVGFDEANQITRSGHVIEARIGNNGKTMALWGSPSDYAPNQIAEMAMEAIVQKKLSPDARLYFSEGNSGGISLREMARGGDVRSSLDGGMISKTVAKVKELIGGGGFTINPRTGEKTGFEPDMYAVSQFGDRQKVFDHKPTDAELTKYMADNGDLLGMEEHHLGGWDNEGKFYLDVVNVLPRAEALDLGHQENQIGIGRVNEADNYEELATGGTGQFPEGYQHPVPAAERLSKYRELRNKRRERPAFDQQLGEQENQLETAKSTMRYAENELGMKPIPEGNPDVAQARFEESMDPILERHYREFEDYQTQGKSRELWYEGAKKATEALSQYFPELKNPAVAALFRWQMNVFGNGDSPSNELVNAIGSWQRTQKSGKIGLNGLKDEHIGNLRGKTWTAQLAELNNLIKLKGIEGTTKWLETKHPISELNAVKDQIKVQTKPQKPGAKPTKASIAGEYGVKMPMEGGYIFGPKLGPYGLNKEGIHGPVTMDSWMNIAYRMTQGILRTENETNPETGAITETLYKKNDISERRIMSGAIRNLAKKFNTTPEDIQAMIWAHVIRPHFERHGQAMKGGEGHHGDFVQRLEKAGWLNRRVRGKGATLKEGARIAREGGVPEGPESGAGPDGGGPKPEDPF